MSEVLYGLYNLILLNVAFFISYIYVKKYRKLQINCYGKISREKTTYIVLYLIFLLYSVFTFFGGDRMAYRDMVADAGEYGFMYFINMEAVYVWFGILVGGSFILWKIIVYGLSLLLIHLSLKRLGVNNLVSLLFFVGLCLISYGSTRGVLAYAVYVFGLSFIKEKKTMFVILGWAIILSSYFFHNSMIPIIAMTPLVYMNLSKIKVIILLLIFPFIQMAFNALVSGVFDQFAFFAEDYDQAYLLQKNDAYFNEARIKGGRHTFAISYLLINLISLFLDSVILLVGFKEYFKERVPERLTTYLSMGFFLFYFAWLLRFSTMSNNMFMHERYLGMFGFYTFILAVPIFHATYKGKILFNLIVGLLFLKFNYVMLLMIYHGIGKS